MSRPAASLFGTPALKRAESPPAIWMIYRGHRIRLTRRGSVWVAGSGPDRKRYSAARLRQLIESGEIDITATPPLS